MYICIYIYIYILRERELDLDTLKSIWSQIRSNPSSSDFALFAFGSVHFTFQKYNIYFLLFLYLDLWKKYKSDGRGLDRIWLQIHLSIAKSSSIYIYIYISNHLRFIYLIRSLFNRFKICLARSS